MYHYFLVFCCAVLFSGCCSRPAPVEPIIDELEQQQAESTVIVERIEVETEKLVTELVYINAPPEVIERATVIVKDAVELKASLEKERILTADLKIRVSDLTTERDELKIDVDRVKIQRNIGISAAVLLLLILLVAFKLR